MGQIPWNLYFFYCVFAHIRLFLIITEICFFIKIKMNFFYLFFIEFTFFFFLIFIEVYFFKSASQTKFLIDMIYF